MPDDDRALTNPARRLHQLLTRAVGEGIMHGNGLGPVLGVSDGDQLTIYRKFAGLLELATTVERRLKLLPEGTRQLYAACMDPIHQALSTLQIGGMTGISNQTLRQTDLALLALAANALDGVRGEAVIQESELSDIRDEAAALAEQVQVADVPAALKAVLIEALERLGVAIEDYNIVGADGIKAAVAEAFGRAVVDREIILPTRDSPIVAKFWDLMARVSDTVAVATFSSQLGQGAAKLLENLMGSA